MNGTAVRTRSNRTLTAALIATVTMLFTAFAAAFLEQRGGPGWEKITLPGWVWINTAVLLLSSVAVEIGRRRASRGWIGVTLVLGFLFLVGQLLLWRELRARGVYLPSSRYSSFVYILTALHGLHLFAGLIALGYAASRPSVLRFCAGFWHFLGLVWIYVLAVLVVL